VNGKNTKKIVAILFCILHISLLDGLWINKTNLAFAEDTTTGQPRELKEEGTRFAKAGKLQQAIDKYKEAIRLKPDYSKAYNNWGNILNRQNKYYEAIEKFKKAIQLDPNDPGPYSNMGTSYNMLKQYDEALTHYKKAVSLDPDMDRLHNNLGNCYINLNRFEEAILSLKEAVRLGGERPEIYFNIVRAYDKLDDGYLALKFMKEAKRIYRSQGNMEKVSEVGKRLRYLYNKYGDNPKPKDREGQAKSPEQGEERELGTGTGFLLGASKYVVTNYHVIEGANSIFVNFFMGEKIRAKVVAQDEKNDVAILLLSKRPKSAAGNIVLGDSSKVEMGQKVFTIGYPMSTVLGKKPKYSEGIINSTTGYYDDPSLFQITVPIQSGNSGGPLFNMDGQVIGVTTSTFSTVKAARMTGTLPQNLNFAVKSLYVRALLQTVSGFSVSKIGIEPVPISPKNDLSSFIKKAKNNIVLIETAIDNSLPEFVEEDNPVLTNTVDRGTDLKEKVRLAKLREVEINERFKTLVEMEALEDSVFSVEDKRKEIQKFLGDFPNRNPKLEEVKKMLNRLKEGREEIKRFIPFTRPQTK
jgi:S1-C subfamily serine protease